MMIKPTVTPEPVPPTQTQRAHLSNLKQRLLTSLVLAPLILAALLVGGLFWAGMGLIFTLVGLEEFYTVCRARGVRAVEWAGLACGAALLGGFALGHAWITLGALACALILPFVAALVQRQPLMLALKRAQLTASGVAYIAAPLGMLIALRAGENGVWWLLTLFCISAGTDTFAYFGGRLWGKRKLAPVISPSKTVEGAIVGAVGGFALALLALWAGGNWSTAAVVMLAFGPTVAILGDLFESALKRHYHVKDSHLAHLNLLPGHGGVLDRIDSALFIAVYGYVWLIVGGLM